MEDEERWIYPIPDGINHTAVSTAAVAALPSHATLLSHDNGVSRSFRTLPPADYLLKVESFSHLSNMLQLLGDENYESGCFEAGGYKWRLSLYPEGDDKRDGNGYVSLYLVLIETNAFPIGWEVNVNFKLFVHDQIRDKYYTVQDVDGEVKRFHQMKTEHGFAKLISLATFSNASNGYLLDDTCIFGAEIFVINNKKTKPHIVSMAQDPLSPPFSWSLHNFSKLDKEYYYSNVISAGGRKWKLQIYPRGDKLHKGCLSLDLHSVDSAAPFGFNFMRWFRSDKGPIAFPGPWGFLVEFSIRVMDQEHGHHEEIIARQYLDTRWSMSKVIRCGNFMSLSDLTDQSKGFLVNDTLIVEMACNVFEEVKI